MDFRILGPLEVREGNREVGLRGGKQRALLALLLVNANRTLGLDRIVDELWGEDVPETAQKMVQIYVSRLRKVLPPGMLHTRPPGYALALEREQLDLHRFERLVTEARASLDAGRAEQASAGFRAALGLWRGPALAEFASEPFAQPEGARLEEFRLSALEERIEADLALGRHADLAGELEALVARDPLRERLRGQQMLALYRGGRQADALAAYHEGRRLLEEELGIDPSPALRDLERRILQQDQALELVSSIPQERRAASARPTRRSRSAARAEAIEPARSPFATAFVGRDGELGRLRRLLDEALAGHRQVVFVSGRPGIGKTALVRIFLEEAQARGGLLVGRGQCFEQYGHGEAFMPVLEAVGRLCRGSDGDELIPLLAARAPTWLSQLPGLAESVGANVGALAVGATRERMLRELVEVLEAITRTRPLALLLEDLHWSDPSTVDALSALTRRDDPARLLLIGTYRPQDARAGSHPVWEAVQALEQRGLASEIRLQALASGAVADYLELRFPESELPFDLSGLLHDRTEGNPLFIEKVVDSWVEGGSIAVVDGVFALKATLPELSVGVPGTVRQLIEHQLDELDGADEELLEAASVAGAEFVAAAVAAACERADDDTERRLAELARQGRFVEVLGEAVWPDGTVSTRYAFVHDLYAEVGYARLSPGRRARLHRAIGARLQSAFGDGAGEVAGELATHLLRGREPDKAITYLDAAAKHALARGGHREAIEHLTTALDALGELPGTRERSERELALQITLGNALIAGRGYAAPETSETYARARELCAELGESAPDFLPVLYGLWNNEIVAARHHSARELADAFLQLAQEGDEDAVVVAHRAVAWCLILDGQPEPARGHLAEILLRFDPERHESLVSLYGEDPAVAAEATLPLPLWLLGFPDQASKAGAHAVARAQTLNHPLSLAYALFNHALLHQLRRESSAAGEDAESARAVAGEFGIALWEAWASILSGWAASGAGAVEEGISLTRAGLRAARATGAVAFLPHCLTLLAEAYARAGRPEAGLQALGEALALCDRNGERYYEAEIHRVRGELLLELETADPAGAEEALRRAIEVAVTQEARMLELRAAVSLGRLWREQGRTPEALELISGIYGWFTEGFETPDLRDAAGLISDLGGAIPPRPAAPSAAARGVRGSRSPSRKEGDRARSSHQPPEYRLPW